MTNAIQDKVNPWPLGVEAQLHGKEPPQTPEEGAQQNSWDSQHKTTSFNDALRSTCGRSLLGGRLIKREYQVTWEQKQTLISPVRSAL